MKEKARVGVIGIGGIANNIHLPSIAEIEGCELVAVCDLHEERAAAAAEKYGVPKVYTLHHEMIEKEQLDGVFCLVEPDRMFRVVDECLDKGLHVFMEKPAGVDAHQANSLVRKAQKVDRLLQVGMNRRCIPLVQYVLKYMKELTPITQVDGVFIKNTDISTVWNYTSAFVCDIVHAVDLIRYFAGAEPRKAATVIGRFNSPVDNAWDSVIEFENGILGTLKSNYQTASRVHTFEIHGPMASAFINLGFGEACCEAKIIHKAGGSIYSMSAKGVKRPELEVIDGKALAGGNEYYQYYGYKQEDQAFIDFLRTGKRPICEIQDAAKTMEMVELLLHNRL